MPAEQDLNNPSSLDISNLENANNTVDSSGQDDKSKEYESSELSDLGEDQSEAETDKMDFLEEENSNPDNVLDLNALSKLTELARLKEIDSDDDFDDTKLEDDTEGSHGKRPAEEEPESNGIDAKKLKLEEKTEEKTAVEDKIDPVNGSEEHGNEQEQEQEKEEQDVKGKEKEDENNEDESHAEAEGEEEEEEEEADKEEGEQELDENGVDINEQRLLAIDDLMEIEKSFAEIKDKLYQDKLKFLEHELQLCLEGSHPELAKIYYKINGFYQDSLRLANHTLNYRLRCINNETIATRTSIHQDFLRRLMDSKNDMILDTTSKWYKINKERNQMDQLVPDFSYTALPGPSTSVTSPTTTTITAPTTQMSMESEVIINGNTNGYTNGYDIHSTEVQISKKELKHSQLIELVQQRNDLNQEVGIINGLVQLHGFPSAISLSLDDKTIPELLLRRANDDEIAEDFKAMGIPI